MIEKLRFQEFDSIYHLMKMNFPCDEYRTYEEQKTLLNNPIYSIYVLRADSQDIKAFIAVWEFNKFAYIEHFVVSSNYRNGGIGTNILNELVELLGKIVCLEVEPPETEMASRRIGFYKRNKFFLNEYSYMQPPISQGKNAIPLFIMTSGSKVDEKTFEKIKSTLYTDVYKCI